MRAQNRRMAKNMSLVAMLTASTAAQHINTKVKLVYMQDTHKHVALILCITSIKIIINWQIIHGFTQNNWQYKAFEDP